MYCEPTFRLYLYEKVFILKLMQAKLCAIDIFEIVLLECSDR